MAIRFTTTMQNTPPPTDPFCLCRTPYTIGDGKPICCAIHQPRHPDCRATPSRRGCGGLLGHGRVTRGADGQGEGPGPSGLKKKKKKKCILYRPNPDCRAFAFRRGRGGLLGYGGVAGPADGQGEGQRHRPRGYVATWPHTQIIEYIWSFGFSV